MFVIRERLYAHPVYIYICVYVCVCMYVYVYIYKLKSDLLNIRLAPELPESNYGPIQGVPVM
jgi:hypothetical protein